LSSHSVDAVTARGKSDFPRRRRPTRQGSPVPAPWGSKGNRPRGPRPPQAPPPHRRPFARPQAHYTTIRAGKQSRGPKIGPETGPKSDRKRAKGENRRRRPKGASSRRFKAPPQAANPPRPTLFFCKIPSRCCIVAPFYCIITAGALVARFEKPPLHGGGDAADAPRLSRAPQGARGQAAIFRAAAKGGRRVRAHG
jgi:hypothetical protein